MNNENRNPLISVLMTSYNCEKYVGEAIQSIIDQTYANWELLIADDCSSDSTREVINKFKDPRIKKHHNTENLHYLRTRNRLAKFVNGDYITLLDADDTCSKDRLEIQLGSFKADKDLGLCGSQVKYINKYGKELAIEDRKLLDYRQIKKELESKNVFTGSTIMVKTAIWKEFDGYRDYFSTFGYEDYDLTSRIAEKYKVINVTQKLYNYRQYAESFTKNNLIANPFKLHGYKLIQQFIKQRANTGVDKLMENDISWIINFILKENQPYIEDSSLIYRDLTWSNYNRKMYKRAFIYLLRAIRTNPLNYKNGKLIIILFLLRLKILKEQ